MLLIRSFICFPFGAQSAEEVFNCYRNALQSVYRALFNLAYTDPYNLRSVRILRINYKGVVIIVQIYNCAVKPACANLSLRTYYVARISALLVNLDTRALRAGGGYCEGDPLQGL